MRRQKKKKRRKKFFVHFFHFFSRKIWNLRFLFGRGETLKHCSQPMNEIRGVICAGLVIQVSGSLIEVGIAVRLRLRLRSFPCSSVGNCHTSTVVGLIIW